MLRNRKLFHVSHLLISNVAFMYGIRVLRSDQEMRVETKKRDTESFPDQIFGLPLKNENNATAGD